MDRLDNKLWWHGLSSLFGYDEESTDAASQNLGEALWVVLEQHGIDPNWALGQRGPQQEQQRDLLALLAV